MCGTERGGENEITVCKTTLERSDDGMVFGDYVKRCMF